MKEEIVINSKLLEELIVKVKEKYPKKAYGYFLSDSEDGDPDDFIIFNSDIRDEWKDTFEDYGNYYIRNHDAGFLATAEEMYRVNKEVNRLNKNIVGVFHTHKRHPAIFSTVDVDMHPSKNLWHLIISLRNLNIPQIKVFSLNENNTVNEMKLKCV